MPAKNRNQLNPLLCKQCGGLIDQDTYVCPYCDTKYERGESGDIEKNLRATTSSLLADSTISLLSRLKFITPEEAESYIRLPEFLPLHKYPDDVIKYVDGEIGRYKGTRIIASKPLSADELQKIDSSAVKHIVTVGKKGDGEKYFKRIIQKIRNRRNKNCLPKTETKDIS